MKMLSDNVVTKADMTAMDDRQNAAIDELKDQVRDIKLAMIGVVTVNIVVTIVLLAIF